MNPPIPLQNHPIYTHAQRHDALPNTSQYVCRINLIPHLYHFSHSTQTLAYILTPHYPTIHDTLFRQTRSTSTHVFDSNTATPSNYLDSIPKTTQWEGVLCKLGYHGPFTPHDPTLDVVEMPVEDFLCAVMKLNKRCPVQEDLVVGEDGAVVLRDVWVPGRTDGHMFVHAEEVGRRVKVRVLNSWIVDDDEGELFDGLSDV